MQKFIFFFCFFLIPSTWAGTNKVLLLVGGGKRPAPAMEKFVKHSLTRGSKFLVIPWASATTESAEVIKTELSNHGPISVSIIPHELGKLETQRLKTLIQAAAGIFFTGGDQNLLMDTIRRYGLLEDLRSAYAHGVSFGGTSAGTAIMSNPMLTGKSDLSVIDPLKTETSEGLGLLPQGIIVDQHFILRSRFNRLASLILGGKKLLGIGIDENTSLLILNDMDTEVIGPTQVLFFSSSSDQELRLKILKNGDKSYITGMF